MAEFKRISETEIVEVPAENDTLLLISNGEVKQVSAAALAAAAGGGSVEPIRLINTSTGGYNKWSFQYENGDQIGAELYDLYLAGYPIMLTYYNELKHVKWFTIIGANKIEDCSVSYRFFFYDYVENKYNYLNIY